MRRFFFVRKSLCVAAGAAALLLSGCATHYLDNATPGVAASEFKRPAQTVPVQLLFDFQSKGVSNARATELLKTVVQEEVAKSGLFLAVEDKPVSSGLLLEVKINNVPLNDDAFSKGFVTGLTFGLAGSQVSDGYVCTVRYINGTATIITSARHAIHTTLGNTAAPGNAQKVKDLNEAALTMTRQIVSTALLALSKDPAFQP